MCCGVKVLSRRALRADPAFDKIIQKFYPDMDAYEEKEEQFISRVNAESHSISALVEEGLRRQVRKKRKRLTARVIPCANDLPCISVFLIPFPAQISRVTCVCV
jgi:hypothetical protein